MAVLPIPRLVKLKKEHIAQAYEFSMITLALVVVVMLGMEFTLDLSSRQQETINFADTTILIIFAGDYFTRLFLSRDKIQFVRNNIWDLIAIIPFSSAFRVARLARLARVTRLSRLSRLTRLVRIVVFCRRFLIGFGTLLRTNGLHYMLGFTAIVILLGAIGIIYFEQGITVDTFADSIWWSLVTTTTVGYGDISPSTTGGRILAAGLMLVGIGFLGMVTGSIATFFVEKVVKGHSKPKGIRQETLEQIKSKLNDFDELSREELQEICKLLWALKREKDWEDDRIS